VAGTTLQPRQSVMIVRSLIKKTKVFDMEKVIPRVKDVRSKGG